MWLARFLLPVILVPVVIAAAGAGFTIASATIIHLGVTAYRLKVPTSSQQTTLVSHFYHQHGGLHIISFHISVLHLLDYDFSSVIDIQSLHIGLALQTAAVEGVPGGVVLGVLGVRRQRDDARGLVVAEVDVERGEAAGQEGAVAANLEVGALGADAGTGSGIVEGVAAAHEQDALVLGVEGRALVRAHEADALVTRCAVVVAAVGCVDGHAIKDKVGLGQVFAALPLNNIRCAGHERRNVFVEVEVKRRAADAGRFEGAGGGAGEGAAVDGDAEGQAQGIPCTILVERATCECHVGHVTVGVADGRAVVLSICQADSLGRHIVASVVEQAVGIERDAACGVCLARCAEVNRCAGEAVSQALVGGHVVCSDIIAVGDGRLVTIMPAGEGVVEHAFVHAAGLHQGVLDGGSVPYRPSDEAAAVGSAIGGGEGAVEQAAVDDDDVTSTAQRADQSAVGAVAVDAAVDADGAAAVIEVQRAERLAHDAGGLLLAGVDGAVDVQVPDDGVLDVAERGAVFLGERLCVGALREGQRMAVAVEDALECFVIADARHLGDADAAGQLHDLAAEASAAVDAAGEDVPVVGGADDVGVVVSACAVEEPRPRGADGDVGVGHGEGGAADGAGRGGVAAEGVARLAAVSQGEADALAAASVVGAAVADAVSVGRDAVSAVGGGGLAETAEGHVRAGADGAGLRALVGGQVVGGHEVTVFNGERAVVAHLGEGVAEYARAHAAGLQQRVADDDVAALTGIAHEAAAVGGSIFVFDRGGNGAVEHAALDGDRVRVCGLCASRVCGQGADQSAISLTIPAVHVHRAAAVDEVQRAFGQGNDAARSP